VPSGILYHGQHVLKKDGGLVTACGPKTGKVVCLQERAAAAGRYSASPAANGRIYPNAREDGACRS
jgi:hypothetical protein